ncbi:MAG: flagellar FlbD family protein [Salinibacterium sp.]|nr:flagellar FlbD family protein [Salinibacterium sp.]MBF0672312.1 flagellar FlbD family protein [Salinibacterium sp.]
MIVVTRLNDRQFAINPDLIERIHASPDTTLVMVDGAKYIVTESMAEVIERIALYRARVIALAHSGAADQPSAPHLGIVTDAGDDETVAHISGPRKI